MVHSDFLHSDTLAISSLQGLKNLSCDIDHWPSLGKPLIGDLTSHRMPGTDLAFRQSLRDNSLEHDYNGSR